VAPPNGPSNLVAEMIARVRPVGSDPLFAEQGRCDFPMRQAGQRPVEGAKDKPKAIAARV
jgi:hypothetical protein